ncbi:hypothetical protein [Acidianus manzaensis]|uniref:Uncharacterized protein n=1 Tax=Acidianus manzaensis TaxID=282676 RepID=A0A1W6K0W6_9CREN|nr:hypothetical protein [Acidianus manzaensis]ARM76137.1 hypothetical protein B6F84_08975 [Acidianus manzaensis]
MEPFYFKSYDKVIGTAHNIKELESEVERLSKEDPEALQYHLKEGHIVSWLNYIGERGLAEILKGVTEPEEAISRIKEYELLKNSAKVPNKRSSKRRKRN